MHADLSRLTFRPERHYSAVVAQQGRVQLDADANEQTAIQLHQVRTLARDLIGRYGGPLWPRTAAGRDTAGFRIEYVGGKHDIDTLLIYGAPTKLPGGVGEFASRRRSSTTARAACGGKRSPTEREATTGLGHGTPGHGVSSVPRPDGGGPVGTGADRRPPGPGHRRRIASKIPPGVLVLLSPIYPGG
jgi:hypothetical protein